MLGTETAGDFAGEEKLVKIALAEANRECLDRRAAELRHLGNDTARVHAAAQEGAQRYVGDQAATHRIAEERAELFDRVVLIETHFRRETYVPVRLDRRAAVLPHQAVAWLQLLDVPERCRG